jgi:hypothetical protein
MSKEKAMPDYRAYTVIHKGQDKNFWVAIGAAFQHRDGTGINILLEALPLDGKIVLRPASDAD